MVFKNNRGREVGERVGGVGEGKEEGEKGQKKITIKFMIKNLKDYLADEAVKKLDAENAKKWIKMCYHKNHNIAEYALSYVMEVPKNKIKISRGAYFTFIFKKLLLK